MTFAPRQVSADGWSTFRIIGWKITGNRDEKEVSRQLRLNYVATVELQGRPYQGSGADERAQRGKVDGGEGAKR